MPEGRHIFGSQGIVSWVLQQDKYPTHRVAHSAVLIYNAKRGRIINLMEGLPPNQPDISLIDKVWAYLDSKMDSQGCKTFTQYEDEQQNEVKLLPRSHTKILFAGMRESLQSCISLEGGKTRHQNPTRGNHSAQGVA